MIQQLIDYRLDGEALYIYDRTDYTNQEISAYNGLDSEVIVDEMINLIIIRNDNGIINNENESPSTYYVNKFEYSAVENAYVATIPYKEEWGKNIYVDLFLLPNLINANGDFLLSPFYKGYIGYHLKDLTRDFKGIYICVKDDNGRTDPLILTSTMDLPLAGGNSDKWNLLWYEDGNANEITQEAYEIIMEQTRMNFYHEEKEFISLLHESTGVNFSEKKSISNDEISNHFNIEKLDCNKYRITPNIDIKEASGISIFNEISGDFIYGNRISPGSRISPVPFPFEFTVPGDGIYSVHIPYKLEGNNLTEDYIFYEYCDLKSCFNKLVKSIYCNDIYCCDDCSTDVKYEQTRRISELNKLTALYTQLMLAIHGHQVLYLMHDYTGNEGYDKYIDSVKTLWEAIQLVYNRCGDCDPNNEELNPCNCN